MRHKWEQVEFAPFSKNPMMRCVRCRIKARKHDARRGGYGDCKPLEVPYEVADEYREARAHDAAQKSYEEDL